MLAGAAVTVERSSGGRFPGHGHRPASPDLCGREQVELPTVAPDAGAALGVAGSARRDSGSLGFPWGLSISQSPSQRSLGRPHWHVASFLLREPWSHAQASQPVPPGSLSGLPSGFLLSKEFTGQEALDAWPLPARRASDSAWNPNASPRPRPPQPRRGQGRAAQ